MISEYILKKDFAFLIGKRAKFKDKLKGYSWRLWNKKGVIIQHKGMEHVGLSLKFDKPVDVGGQNMLSCYITKESIELITGD